METEGTLLYKKVGYSPRFLSAPPGRLLDQSVALGSLGVNKGSAEKRKRGPFSRRCALCRSHFDQAHARFDEIDQLGAWDLMEYLKVPKVP